MAANHGHDEIEMGPLKVREEDQAEGGRGGDAGGGSRGLSLSRGLSGFSPSGTWRRTQSGLVRSAQYYSNLIVVPRGENVERRAKESDQARYRTKVLIGADVHDHAKIIEIYPKSQKFSVPYFIISISILELCVFLYHVVNLKNTRCIEIDAHGPVPICSVLIYNPYRRYEVWRLMTYLAVHGGYIHIASNIIDPWAYLAGASGGVYAILAAHAPTMIMNWREMRSAVEWLVSILILLVGAIDLSLAIYARYISTDGTDSSVGYAAHLGGAAAGFLVGMNVLRNFKTMAWEGWLRLVSFLVWSLGIVAAVLVNGLAGDALYPPSDFGDIRDCDYYPGCGGAKRD